MEFKCDLCDYTPASKHGVNVHIGRSHRGPKKQENLRHNAPNNSLNLSDADETRSESEHLENSTILKHTEEKSVQVENDLDLVLTGEVCDNSKRGSEPVTNSTIKMSPDDVWRNVCRRYK